MIIIIPFFNGDDMLIKFRTTLDPVNVLNKNYTNEHTETVNAKKDFDVQNPVIDLLIVAGEDFSSYNCFEIPEINRSYSIKSIEKVNSEIVRITSETDYLETYRDSLLTLDCDYLREIKLGDYGKVNLSTTGETVISSIPSEFEPVLEVSNVLSVMKQDRYTV